jgi:hypothetical protein
MKKKNPFVGFKGQAGKDAVEAFINGEEAVFPDDIEADRLLAKFLADDIQRSE